MAILAMDQYAHLLAERIRAAGWWRSRGPSPRALRPADRDTGALRWLRAADTLPHGWDATSDSVAAFVAGALDAVRLDLIKPAEVAEAGVEACFGRGAGGAGGVDRGMGAVLEESAVTLS